MANIDPDTLLKKVDKKGMSGDLVLSIVLHALVIGLTSFGLYASWMKWGVHSPSQIKVLEKAAAKEAAKAAAEVGAVYVDAGPLGDKDENKAIGLFSHGGVANHPGDLGMKRLADLILKGFK